MPDSCVNGLLLGWLEGFKSPAYTYCISCKKFSRVFYINSLHRASSMEKPSRGGEKRTAVWASQHEERGSDGAVAPPMCEHRVVLHRCVGREGCHPSGATGATCLHAAARMRWAARAVQGDVVS